MADPRRRLPSVDALLRSAPGSRLSERFGRDVAKHALRSVLDAARRSRAKEPPTSDALLARAARILARMSLGLSEVVNATGVVLHTNLGRSPLPPEAVRASVRAARVYSDLEVDREAGRRGRRTARAEFQLTALTGAEDALVVNNNAAALLLALTALARRKDVLVSRGELIEIGGEFRLPDIMSASGARLVEVGTTNRTRLADYRRALTPRTGLVLKVHPSNYRVVGFAESPGLGELAALAGKAEVPLLHDIGSGVLSRWRDVPKEEPTVEGSLAAGADLVCFSGDKLLGGPQAGVIVGRGELVGRLRRHPVARAVRVDKMTVASLEAVLRMYAQGRRGEIPVWRELSASLGDLRTRAAGIAREIPGARVERSEAVAGGGSLPGFAVPSYVVRLDADDPDRLAARLRVGNPPVFCRVEATAVLFDVRTVEPRDEERLVRAVHYALSQEA